MMALGSKQLRAPRSLRSQLIVAIASTTLLVLSLTASVLYGLLRQNLYAQFDDLLGAKARALASMIEQDGTEIDVEFAAYPLQEFARQERPEYFQVWDDNGAVIARSRRLGEDHLPLINGSRIAPGIESLQLPDGRPGRAVGLSFLPRVEGEELETASSNPEENDTEGDGDPDGIDFSRRRPVTLVVARETADVERVLSHLLWLLPTSALLASLTIVTVLAWAITQRLAPVDELTKQMNEVDADHLNDRVQVMDLPSELQPVVERLNDLIARLQVAFEHEKRLVADMAHELRTPLAGIRSTLEVGGSRHRKANEYRLAIEKSLRICRQTESIVCTLLSLARIESGREVVDTACVDLKLVLHDCWEPWQRQAINRELTVDWDVEPGVFLQTDATMFRLVLQNLYENAVTYTNHGGNLEVTTTTLGNHYVIHLTNTGCELSEPDLTSIFDRFWRADESRTAVGVHAGLGLSLSRRIVDALGGNIAVNVREGRFEVCLRFDNDSIDREDLDEERPRMRTLSSVKPAL